MLRMPSAFYLPVLHPAMNWGYQSEAEAHLDHRRLACPRGRVVGGSSSINGMVYIRGNPADFDRWEQLGAAGWNYQNVLPYFKKAQSFAGLNTQDPYKGHAGPLSVTNGTLTNPLYRTFLKAAQQAGYPLNPDLNGPDQEGFGPLPMTVANGVRASAAQAYLHPVRQRTNLNLLTHANVTHLVFAEHKVIGAQVVRRGKTTVHYADEVILSAGAINSPHLLMLSGIGPPQELTKHGVTVRVEMPGVGQNLMDHLEIYVQQACQQPVSLYKNLSLFGRGKIGLQWLWNKSGLGATNHFEVGGFIRSTTDKPYPDIQFHFLPAAMQYDGSTNAKQHGFQAHVGPMLSQSRGHVSLRGASPDDPPRITFNYMSHPNDWTVFRAAIRAARNIFAQSAFDTYRGPELRPGADTDSDADLDAFIRRHAESAYHPCGTCRMGSDAQAVVDHQGKVHGLHGLRVVDASIFPHITNGNLNAPTIMVAERIADMM
jgi:choline dehydrogenase